MIKSGIMPSYKVIRQSKFHVDFYLLLMGCYKCDVCRRIKAEHQRPVGTLQPLSIPECKWDKVGMDFITGFPRTQKGNDVIFVVIDRLSKVAHFLPVRESITASQLADLYVLNIFIT